MKLINIAFILGLGLIFIPPSFDFVVNRWVYYLMCLTGTVLCSVAGYNAQAAAVGSGEPGEALLQRGLRWFKRRIRRRDVQGPSPVTPGDVSEPRPSRLPRSLLSRTVLSIGVLMVLLPTTLNWNFSQSARIALIGTGCLLVLVSTRNFPPQGPRDLPEGKEMLQAAWRWLLNR